MVKLTVDHKRVDVSVWNFPGGELGVKLNELTDINAPYVIHVTGIPTSNDIIVALNIADALKRQGIDRKNVTLHIPYFPYARQDRVCSEGESFALNVFVQLIATGFWSKLIVVDPHSEVTTDLLAYCQFDTEVLTQSQAATNLPKHDILIAPDKGARAKVYSHQQVSRGTEVITLNKVRQDRAVVYAPITGVEIDDKTVCVVDDLVDGGRTFLSLVEAIELTGQKPAELNLYVTHGIFSQGVDALREKYDNIFVFNLMNESVRDKVIVLSTPC